MRDATPGECALRCISSHIPYAFIYKCVRICMNTKKVENNHARAKHHEEMIKKDRYIVDFLLVNFV